MPLGCKLPLKGLGSQGGLGSGLNPTRLSSGSSPRRHGRVTKPALTRVTARQSRKRPCFSARGAISTRAWGIAPGNSVPRGKALKARFIPLASSQSHTHNATRNQCMPAQQPTIFILKRASPMVNRAFSAGGFAFPRILGRCPRLAVNVAPLALTVLCR